MTERILHLDCSAGVSGDMMLGALLDLGVPLKALRDELAPLSGELRIVRSRATRGGIRGTRVRVDAPGDRGHRYFRDFARAIAKGGLRKSVRERSLMLLRRLFEAEARVHGKKADEIHLHELGSLDTLVDVVGTVVAVETLGPARITSSPVNVGGGHVVTEHGRLAVPAPATMLLLEGTPVFSDGDFERTTPTGALLVSGLADGFGPWPAMTVRKTGYGLGSRDPKGGRANALRAVLGDAPQPAKAVSAAVASTWVVQATVDDMTPEQVGYLQDTLRNAGVLDVFVSPVLMKKNRPGFDITILADAAGRKRATDILLRESSTFGVRAHSVEREILERRSVPVKTPHGTVRIKEGVRDGRVIKTAPEYEDCRSLAEGRRVPIEDVQRAALFAYRKKGSS